MLQRISRNLLSVSQDQDLACYGCDFGRILSNPLNLPNSENSRLPKTESQSSKEFFSENQKVLKKNSKFANKSYISQKSRKPSAFGSGRFWNPSKPIVFRRVD